ncbi:MAG: hypothetical protein ACR2QE_05360, partial [Acidimicrobiales bacterium]
MAVMLALVPAGPAATAPPTPSIWATSVGDASTGGDAVLGFDFAPSTPLTISVNGLPVGDPPTSDGTGFFSYDNPTLDLGSGDVVSVSDGTSSKTLTLAALSFDNLNYTTGAADGTTDQPDGTQVDVWALTSPTDPPTETLTTTASGSAWATTFTMSLADRFGVAFIFDGDGDATAAGGPPPPQIRASTASNPDRVEGGGFAPSTLLTLKVNTVAVADSPTTDTDGNFNYDNPTFDLTSGDVVEVTDGTTTRTLTTVGVSFDTLNTTTDTATGTSDQPDTTPVRVDVGNETLGETIETTVTSAAWTAAFTIDIDDTMGGQASITEPDGDETFADAPQPPQIQATTANNPDRVECGGFAPATLLTFKVNAVAVADPPTSDTDGNFNYGNETLDLGSGDVVEVTDGTSTRDVTLVGLTFDTLDTTLDTATGTSDQPNGTEVQVDVGNESGGEQVITTVT